MEETTLKKRGRPPKKTTMLKRTGRPRKSDIVLSNLEYPSQQSNEDLDHIKLNIHYNQLGYSLIYAMRGEEASKDVQVQSRISGTHDITTSTTQKLPEEYENTLVHFCNFIKTIDPNYRSSIAFYFDMLVTATTQTITHALVAGENILGDYNGTVNIARITFRVAEQLGVWLETIFKLSEFVYKHQPSFILAIEMKYESILSRDYQINTYERDYILRFLKRHPQVRFHIDITVPHKFHEAVTVHNHNAANTSH